MNIGDNMLVLCTYSSLVETCQKVLDEYGISVDVEVMDSRFGLDMDKLLAYVESYKDKGKEIIISRGFLAKLIKENLDFKVIEIQISEIEVLEALYPYAGKDIKIGVIEVIAFIDVVKEVASTLGISIFPYEVKEAGDFDKNIEKAFNDGMDLIVGGAWKKYGLESSKDYPIPYVFIESGENSIRKSLKLYMDIYKQTYLEKKYREMLQKVIDLYPEGIFIVDENNKILLSNPYIEKILQVKNKDILYKNINEIGLKDDIKKIIESGEASLGKVRQCKGKNVLIDIVPMKFDVDSAGAFVTIRKAEDIEEEEKKIRTRLSEKSLLAKYTFDSIIGQDPKMEELKRTAEAYAKTNATVLIQGESGTGKEVFAQAIHMASHRKKNPFVAINFSSFPKNLIESELFGYVEGAFTGAKRGGKMGIFELAHGGTLFLDEIGEIDEAIQVALLRVIQEREIMRIGDDKLIKVDVRIIAATNKNLYEEVFYKRFRDDLYFRLSVLNLKIPPIKERKEDIPLLVNFLLNEINEEYGFDVSSMDKKVLEKLISYDWPGNVRELRNTVERIAILVQTGNVDFDRIKPYFTEEEERVELEKKSKKEALEGSILSIKEAERQAILKALRETDNNKTRAADLLGINRTTLNRKLAEYQEDDAF